MLAGPTVCPLHRHQLLAERQVLHDQFSMSRERQRQRTTDDHHQLEHVDPGWPGRQDQLGRVLARVTGVACRRNVHFGEREISIEVIPLAGSSGGQSFLILFDDGSHLAVGRVPAATTVLTETEKD